MGEAKWYLGMHIRQHKDYITLDQDQYVKNITSRFEKQFKHSFKLKDSLLPSSFIPSKKDCPKTEADVVKTLNQQLDEHNAQQAIPMWGNFVDSPVLIDKHGEQPYEPGDEYIYWPN